MRITHYFSIFSNKTNKPCVNFSSVWRKTQTAGNFRENFENLWWTFNRKLEFIIIFGKFVTKNIAFWNKTILLQQFFQFRVDFPLPHCYVHIAMKIHFKYFCYSPFYEVKISCIVILLKNSERMETPPDRNINHNWSSIFDFIWICASGFIRLLNQILTKRFHLFQLFCR